MTKAIIFDMDGVIADTQGYHAQIESEILNRFGVKIGPEEITKKFAGVRTEDFIKFLLAERQIAFDIKEIMQEKWRRINAVCGEKLESMPGVIDLIKSAHNAGLKLAVASASSKDFIRMVLSKLEIADYFLAVVSADEVVNGKPSPDIFLLAAQELSIQPADCVVIEDGVNGMIAAKAAGMRCLGLTNDKQAPADIVVSNFSEISIEIIINL